MRDLNFKIREVNEELNQLSKKLKEEIDTLPLGRLVITHNKNKAQYYYRDGRNKKIYISKKDIDFIRKLAQRDYATKIKIKLDKMLKELQNIYGRNFYDEIYNVYDNMHDARKELITPYLISDDEYARKWMESYHSNTDENTYENTTEIWTEKGEHVRSKTEKIIADKLFYLKIPYKYEPRLTLFNERNLYPDFIVLNKRTRKEYYWEHFGLMTNAQYCSKAIEKIALYERNGMYIGEDIIVTFESENNNFNIKDLNNIINHFLV